MLCGNAVGITCSGVSFILLLTGILTDYWLVNFGSNLFHEGIWQQCTKNICFKITGRGYIDATRGLLIFSVALIVISMLFSCLVFFKLYLGKVSASLAAGIIEALAVLFLLIGMAVYTSETSDRVLNSSFNYQWSFFLCWVAGFSLIVAAVSHVMAHRASPLPGYDSV